MKVLITKYALTDGIQEIEVEECGSDMVRTPGSFTQYFHKGEWFVLRADAVADAEQRRQRKLKSLRKSITKMENLKFD